MRREGKLEQVYQYLCAHGGRQTESFWVPALWNQCGYDRIAEERAGEIRVHPYDFFKTHLEMLFEQAQRHSLTARTRFDESVIYSSLARYSTAWDVNHDGQIESGTFLRLILLLPLLKKMGVNILYLLPVTRYSELKKKGEMGSPYAVQTLMDLDPNLHDPLLDGMPGLSIHDELAALVEACHLLDVKVVMDFVPRVTARNSDWIREHPEWVYWIKKEALEGFRPPEIPGLGPFQECTPDKLERVYRSEGVAEFLKNFSQPPNVVNPSLWERLKARAEETGTELLTLVEEEMGLSTSPAHSDWINDTQPIWTDITFLRLYKDVSPAAKPFLPEDQAPYVLFDTIKSHDYPGEDPNIALWDALVGAVRFQLETYGIDGFRLDMGHVLPAPLLANLFRAIKQLHPEPILINEGLFNRDHENAANAGYSVMLGSGWNVMTHITKGNLLTYLQELPGLKIPVFACAETADTPRITSRGGVQLARMIAVFNHFLPNAIPFLTTGFEMNEAQPLNCGLGDNTNGAEIPRAFFHRMTVSWTNPDAMILLLSRLSDLKKQWSSLIKPSHFFIAESPQDIIVYGYRREGELLVGCYNLNAATTLAVSPSDLVPGYSRLTVLLDTNAHSQVLGKELSEVRLQPNQALILGLRGVAPGQPSSQGL